MLIMKFSFESETAGKLEKVFNFSVYQLLDQQRLRKNLYGISDPRTFDVAGSARNAATWAGSNWAMRFGVSWSS